MFTIKKNLKFIKPGYLFFIGLIFSVCSSFISIVIPLLIKNIIDIKHMLLNVLHQPIVFQIAILLILQVIVGSIGDFLISREGEKQIFNIRLRVQEHLIHLPVNFFDNQTSGQLASRVINDSAVVKNFVVSTIPQTLTGCITIIGSIIILFSLDWKLLLVLVLIFPLDALVTIPLGKFEERITEKTQNGLSHLTSVATESIYNIRGIKLNTAENNVINQFKKHLTILYKLSLKSDLVYAITSPIQSMVSFALILVLILYGSLRVQQGSLSIGTLTSFLIYFFQMINPINEVALFYTNYKQMRGAIAKIKEIISEKKESYKDESHLELNAPYSINIKNVTFSYGQKKILQNLNMSFPSEKKVAIVGPSGAGKSTIINLITGLYTVDSGEILINNVPVNKLNLTYWRELFGVVSQENSIFSGTIYENLIFGLSHEPNKKEVYNALEMANLITDIKNLKTGINTTVGEQGIKLSGGQRQRLQIARAYLKKPKFLILDEATSNLDADSEKQVSLALDKLMREKTIITIAHRLSTIVNADVIYFLNDRKILSAGTHEELINKVPMYRRFVKEQFINSKS